MRTETLIIDSQEDFVKLLERFNIDWTASLSTFVRGVLRKLHDQGLELVVIRFADSVIGKSYKNATYVKHWLQTSIAPKSEFPYLQNSHPYGQETLVIKASTEPLPAPRFKTDLVNRLKASTSSQVFYPLEDVPPIYHKQPYLLHTMLRRKGFKNASTTKVGNSLVITYEKIKSTTVFTIPTA